MNIESKGFLSPVTVRDFPIRDKAVDLIVRRRRWKDLRTGKCFTAPYDDVREEGTRYSKEFAAFLKDVYGEESYDLPFAWPILPHKRRYVWKAIEGDIERLSWMAGTILRIGMACLPWKHAWKPMYWRDCSKQRWIVYNCHQPYITRRQRDYHSHHKGVCLSAQL